MRITARCINAQALGAAPGTASHSKNIAAAAVQLRLTGSTRGCSARRFAVPDAAGPMLVGGPGWRRKRHRRNCAAPSRAHAAAAELTGSIGTAQTVKSAVTLLLRCESLGCEVTTLLRNPWEPAPLLGFGPPAVVINGGVTDLVSQQ